MAVETVGDRVRLLRRRRHPRLSQGALGEAIGKSRSWVVRVEDGTTDPQLGDVADLARFFEVSPEYLLGMKPPDAPAQRPGRPDREGDERSGGWSNVRSVGSLSTGSRLPVLDVADAGVAIDHGYQDERHLEIGAELFGLRRGAVFVISGECLRDRLIVPGDYLIVDEDNTDPQDGEVVVARVNGVCTAKLFYRVGGVVELRPASLGFETIIVRPGDELEIVGVYAGVVRAPRRR